MIATKQTPATITHLRGEYDRMTGGLVISPDALGEIRSLVGDATTGPALVQAIRRALDARFAEGCAEAQDFGEVLDPATGTLRRVQPRGRVDTAPPRDGRP